MATITVRGIGDDVRDRLRVRAARNGRSMEAEVRDILTRSATADTDENVGRQIYEAFQRLGGVDLPLPPRDDEAPAADIP